MKANEFRIGNLILLFSKRICKVIKIEGKSFTVKADDISDVSVFPNMSNGVEPIPLTEEWLIKFGFDVNNRPNWIDQLQEYSIVCGNTQYLKGSAKNIMPIKYVHQLQNLYFALTGEELTCK